MAKPASYKFMISKSRILLSLMLLSATLAYVLIKFSSLELFKFILILTPIKVVILIIFCILAIINPKFATPFIIIYSIFAGFFLGGTSAMLDIVYFKNSLGLILILLNGFYLLFNFVLFSSYFIKLKSKNSEGKERR